MAILSETITIPIWTVVAATAAVIVAAALLMRSAAKWQRAVAGALALLALSLAALPLLQPSGSRSGATEAVGPPNEATVERQALETRRADLSARSAQSGSPLVCLDGLAGEPVETACEPAVFATPQSVALAVSYAAARLQLLADGLAFARRSDPDYEASLAELRRAVENDAFGIYAHVLAIRDGCTPERCAAFELVRDAATLQIHLRQRRYGTYVAEYRDRWGGPVRPTVAVPVAAIAAAAQFAPMPAPAPVPPETAPPPTAVVAPPVVTAPAEPPPPLPKARPTTLASRTDAEEAASVAPPPEAPPAATEAPPSPRGLVPPSRSVLPNISYPSASSIPAISIMAAEPKLPPSSEASSAAPSTAPRRPAPPQ